MERRHDNHRTPAPCQMTPPPPPAPPSTDCSTLASNAADANTSVKSHPTRHSSVLRTDTPRTNATHPIRLFPERRSTHLASLTVVLNRRTAARYPKVDEGPAEDVESAPTNSASSLVPDSDPPTYDQFAQLFDGAAAMQQLKKRINVALDTPGATSEKFAAAHRVLGAVSNSPCLLEELSHLNALPLSPLQPKSPLSPTLRALPPADHIHTSPALNLDGPSYTPADEYTMYGYKRAKKRREEEEDVLRRAAEFDARLVRLPPRPTRLEVAREGSAKLHSWCHSRRPSVLREKGR
eukprot:Sspe_Gene.62465::Locus_35099_Transcript_1_1_Confidence_1.000_Length_942::g.62465::m.62465